jgi:16S rRNA C967 or C1407 C5-methylase (RsmB/RsmF family)/NOL1/NOP2/fmu family ribosome biogenesis protein
MDRELPKEFLVSIENKLGNETTSFLASLDDEAVTSVRYNLRKPCQQETGEQIPWITNGYCLNQRPNFTLDPLFHAGAYYVQEASSMFLYHVLQELIPNPKEDLSILDLCAAPGGKSTTILDYLKGRGMLVSNEVIQSRVLPLVDNIIKWGYDNVVVTNNDGATFGKATRGWFDVMVVDAPCSGEGMFRKSENAIRDWSLDNVYLCSTRQRRILSDSIPALKEGGYLIYSTCTYNDEENIKNVVWLGQNFGLEPVNIKYSESWGIEAIKSNGYIGYQFYPHRLKGEGYFLSALVKRSPSETVKPINISSLKKTDKHQTKVLDKWIVSEKNTLANPNGDVFKYNEITCYYIHHLIAKAKVRYSGVRLGQINKNILIPHHALALENEGIFIGGTLDLNLHDAKQYLRKELLRVNSEQKGWLKVTYHDLGLGWMKNLGNRINNYLPKALRIKNF